MIGNALPNRLQRYNKICVFANFKWKKFRSFKSSKGECCFADTTKGTTVKCIAQRSSILLYTVGCLWGIRGIFVGYSWDIHMYRVCIGYVSGMYRECVGTYKIRCKVVTTTITYIVSRQES